MSEWWLLGILAVFALAASMLVVYPLRRHVIASIIGVVFIFVGAFLGYAQWGDFASLQQYRRQLETQKQAQKILSSVKSPQELIEKLRAKLNDKPKSAKGWYLLGRLYSSQNELLHAKNAFAKAYAFKPNHEQYAVNYAHSLWLLNGQKFNIEITEIFERLLKNHPNQPDALAMLAMNAYLNKAYEEALNYWRRLLTIATPGSEEALAIQKALIKAEKEMQGSV